MGSTEKSAELEATLASTETTTVPRGGSAATAPTGYTLGDVLGKGGMGEVLLAQDHRIGRAVGSR